MIPKLWDFSSTHHSRGGVLIRGVVTTGILDGIVSYKRRLVLEAFCPFSGMGGAIPMRFGNT
jgi:hypothetical protein